ncbi:MAG: hypothetical protein FWG31_04005 [Oscillospiraceae bacterium]|nr:hypothetical protein [Oscillospiraceae bacterium]
MKRILSVLVAICLAGSLLSGCSGQGKKPAGGVDLDLSILGSVVAYSQLVTILQNSDDYLGKTIKIKGQYYSTYFEQTGLIHHFVMVGDEASCCQQGLEFIWKGGYPEEEQTIDITGVLETYEAIGNIYVRLALTELTVHS